MTETMNGADVLKVLKDIRKEYENLWKSIDRKRSWRPSEKAMTKGGVNRKLIALDRAIQSYEVANSQESKP